jgi:hypothetical protein
MTHCTTDVTVVKDPSQSFRKGIRNVDDAWNMLEDNVTAVFPFLDGKKLDIHMACTVSWLSRVDHFDGSRIILVNDGGKALFEVGAKIWRRHRV